MAVKGATTKRGLRRETNRRVVKRRSGNEIVRYPSQQKMQYCTIRFIREFEYHRSINDQLFIPLESRQL